MPTTRALALVTLAAATLGTAGCRTAGEAGQFLGAVLGTAAAVMLDNTNDDYSSYDEYEHHDDHHDHNGHHGHHCRR